MWVHQHRCIFRITLHYLVPNQITNKGTGIYFHLSDAFIHLPNKNVNNRSNILQLCCRCVRFMWSSVHPERWNFGITDFKAKETYWLEMKLNENWNISRAFWIVPNHIISNFMPYSINALFLETQAVAVDHFNTLYSCPMCICFHILIAVDQLINLLFPSAQDNQTGVQFLCSGQHQRSAVDGQYSELPVGRVENHLKRRRIQTVTEWTEDTVAVPVERKGAFQ